MFKYHSMATNETLIPVPGRLHSIAVEGHVAGADEIYDDSLEKTQSTINSEVKNQINGYTFRSVSKTVYQALIDAGTVDENTIYFIIDDINPWTFGGRFPIILVGNWVFGNSFPIKLT